MSEPATPSKAGWSDAEKYQFLLLIIKQLGNDKAPKFSEINMPGRTTKALSHAWAKIKSEAAAAGTGASAAPAVPQARTPASGNKRRAKGQPIVLSKTSLTVPGVHESPTKKSRTASKKVKKEDDEQGDESEAEAETGDEVYEDAEAEY